MQSNQKDLADLRANTEKLRSAKKFYNGADDQFWDPDGCGSAIIKGQSLAKVHLGKIGEQY